MNLEGKTCCINDIVFEAYDDPYCICRFTCDKEEGHKGDHEAYVRDVSGVMVHLIWSARSLRDELIERYGEKKAKEMLDASVDSSSKIER